MQSNFANRLQTLALSIFFSTAILAQNSTNTQPLNQTGTAQISIVAVPGAISLTGMHAPMVHVSVFNEKWLLVSGQWVSTQNLSVPHLQTGNYFVRVDLMNAERSASLAQKEAFVFVPDEPGAKNSDGISVTGGNQVKVTGLPANQARVSVFNEKWLLLERRFSATPETTVSNLYEGNYFVRVEIFNADRSAVLETKDTYVAIGGDLGLSGGFSGENVSN